MPKRYLLAVVIGFLLGFIVLHPFSMLIQDWSSTAPGPHHGQMLKAFSGIHLPMAFFFGILGLLIGLVLLFLVDALGRERKRVEALEGLLPICSYCKKIREEKPENDAPDKWVMIEEYISRRTDADFTHGICPECFEQEVGEPLPSKKKE